MNTYRDASQDIRYALRTLRREPAFVAGVILTFALAIGMNAAMFGLVERLMLAPPPGIRDAAEVVRVGMDYANPNGDAYTVTTTSYPTFRAVAGLDRAFSAVAAVRSDTMTTGTGEERSEVGVVQASGNYFSLLGVTPARGRFFGPADDELPAGNTVVVLSDAYWRRRFGGDASVIGQDMIVDDHPYTIIGIAPRGFNGTELSSVDLFVPLSAAMRNNGPSWSTNGGMRVAAIIARVRPGTSLTAAATMTAAAIRGDAAAAFNGDLASVSLPSLVPGRAARQSSQGRIALWLSGVSLIVLLIATANVGTLLLLRAARRRREMAVRIALGAARGRLVRQSLVESVLLALLGATVGLFVARWFADGMRVLLPNLPAATGVIDRTVLFASLIAAAGAGVIAGLAPLAHFGRKPLTMELRTGGGHGSSGRFAFQNVLVGLQVALCTVALVGASLFVRSLHRVQSQDLGFSTARLLYATLDFRGRYPGSERDLVYENAARRLTAIPGITGVSLAEGVPFGPHHIPPISIPGLTKPVDSFGQIPIMYAATPAYLDMMDVKLVQGRLFTAQDGRGPLVVLVNETMVRNLWPGENPIGKCVRAGFPDNMEDADPADAAAQTPCREVVGVVRDSRARSLRTEGNEAKLMQYYVPFEQIPAPPVPNFAHAMGIIVRVTGDPSRLATSVQRSIQSGSTLPVYAKVRPYQELIDPQLRSWRLGATLFSVFGVLALGIAAVGLSAVISYLVTQRTQEIGVRLALGGTGARVARLVVRDAARMAGAGIAAGLVIALLSAPFVQSMLFQTEAREPASLIVAAGLMILVAVVAAAVPALRASRVSPMKALRADM